MTTLQIIEHLRLQKSPYDGGYFKRTYTAPDGNGSAIYYLITQENYSRLHTCESDEMYHFYQGAPATLLVIDEKHNFKEVVLGPDIENGQHMQYLVQGGQWQALKIHGDGEYSLFGVTVWPEFKPTEYGIQNRKELLSRFGDTEEKKELIIAYTEEGNVSELGLGSNS